MWSLIGVNAKSGASAPAQTGNAYKNLPLQFEPNRGQVDTSMKYVSRGQGHKIYLQPDAATFDLHREDAGT